jgi:hypothetical protein
VYEVLQRQVSSPFPFFLPFPLQTRSISPGTRRIVSVVQVAVPGTEASVFPGREKMSKNSHHHLHSLSGDRPVMDNYYFFSKCHLLSAFIGGRGSGRQDREKELWKGGELTPELHA